MTSTSSTFWTSSTSDQRDANASSVYTSARRRTGSSGVAYRPWTVLTTIGTPASRPTTRPYSPGFGLCVCSTVGRSRRRIRHSSVAARRSDHGLQPRVDAASGTCRTPRRSIAGDERSRRADPDGLASGGDDGVELRAEQQREAHVDRRQVSDAQRPRRQRRARLGSRPEELGHRDAGGVVDAVAAQHHAHGAGEDADVEGERCVVHVPDVHGQPVVPPRRVAPVHLGPAGDARPDLQPAGLGVVVPGEVRHRQGPRPDERHLAAHHVEQRRQLVEARRPQEPADPGQRAPCRAADRPRRGEPVASCGT